MCIVFFKSYSRSTRKPICSGDGFKINTLTSSLNGTLKGPIKAYKVCPTSCEKCLQTTTTRRTTTTEMQTTQSQITTTTSPRPDANLSSEDSFLFEVLSTWVLNSLNNLVYSIS